MSKPYLEITYRQGKPFAAYLYLDRRAADISVRTEPRGKVLVDFSDDGRPIGIEMTAVSAAVATDLRQTLKDMRITGITSDELAPLEPA